MIRIASDAENLTRAIPMANPHPTKSKPCKIGRKHTKTPGIRQKGRAKSSAIKANAIKLAKIKKYKAQVSAFWRGERDDHPELNL